MNNFRKKLDDAKWVLAHNYAEKHIMVSIYEKAKNDYVAGFDANKEIVLDLINVLNECKHPLCVDPHPVFRCDCPKHKLLRKIEIKLSNT